MIFVDGTGHLLGRLSSIVAKKIILGEQVFVFNSEKIIVTGKKEVAMEKFARRQELKVKGSQWRNPKFPRSPQMIFKQAVKGMVPVKKKSGRLALRRLRAFVGVPKEYSSRELEKFERALNKSERPFMTIGEISTRLGIRWQSE